MGNADLPAFLRRAARRKPANQRTGMQPVVAAAKLVTQRVEEGAAEQAVHEVIAARFPAFAGSWQQYISNGGYIYDLFRLPVEQRQALAARLKLDRVLELTEQAAADPVMAISNIPLLSEMSQLSSRAGNREDPEHPARVILIEAHSFAPELATAVLLYSRAVPGWVHPIIIVMVLICLGIFLLAVADPHNQVFHTEDFNRAGWVHYTVLPLFIIGMACAEAYLLRNRKRWDKAWRDALEMWRGAWKSTS